MSDYSAQSHELSSLVMKKWIRHYDFLELRLIARIRLKIFEHMNATARYLLYEEGTIWKEYKIC